MVGFKSNPEFYFKEYMGRKKNTIRKIEEHDPRKIIIDKYLNIVPENLIMQIRNSKTQEWFEVVVRDVSFYEGWYIISW